jgi:hypothetical protein
MTAAAFFADMREAAERAGASAGWRDHDLVLAGRRLRLRFAGPALTGAMLPAFAHLDAPPEGDPDLTVLLWDSASTGVARPPVPWTREDVGVLGQVADFNDERVRTAVAPLFRGLNLLDREARTGVFWCEDPGQLTWSERANPLRVLVHWALTDSGCQLAHAGAVGAGGRGALVAGGSGAGKSTTAAACLEAGFDYAGDDHVLVTTGGPTPIAHAVYATAKLSQDLARRVPGLARAVVNRDEHDAAAALRPLLTDEKLVADVHARWPDRLGDVPVDAIVLPRIVAGRESRLRSATPGAALRALAPSTIMQLPQAGGAPQLGPVAELVRRAPTHVLELGTDAAAVPDLLASLLDRTPARA